MAARITPDGADSTTYRGLPSVYEFVNADGEHRRFNCGQAAACSLLAFVGAIATDLDAEVARLAMTAVEGEHPPDNLWGWFGTSRRRVERICHRHGVDLAAVAGEEALRRSLAMKRPVMVMIQTDGSRFLKWRIPGGHWMLAYGCDDRQVFFTNNSGCGMSWAEFRDRWHALVPRLVGMRNVGLAAVV
jgi:hypothetical protein